MTASPNDSGASPRRPLRRVLKWLGFGMFYWLLIEGGAFVLMKRQLEGVPLYKRMEAVQEDTAAVAELTQAKSLTIRNDFIHPYLGYLPRKYRKMPENMDAVYDAGLYRPDSPIYSAEESDLIVAVTGGSLAGQFMQFGGLEELGPLLTKIPRFEGRNVRFVGLVAGGFKQPQQLMSLSWVLALGGRLDVLINIDGFNEIGLHERENQPHDVSFYYPRAWYPRVQGMNIAATMGELQYRRRLRAQELRAFQTSPVSWSPLRSLLWLRQDKEREAENNTLEHAVRGVANAEQRDIVVQGPRPQGKDAQARLPGMAEVWFQGSLNLHRICGSAGIEYFHFLQPNQYLEGSKTMGPEEQAIALARNNFRRDAVRSGYPKLLEREPELVDAGVRFHDLRNVFQDVQEAIYKDACCHVNELGNVYIARQIAASIASWL